MQTTACGRCLCVCGGRELARLLTRRTYFSWVHKWSSFKRWQDLARDEKDFRAEEHRMKHWLRSPDGMYITPERREHIKKKKDWEDLSRRDSGAVSMDFMLNHTQMRYVDHSWDNVRRFRRYRHFQHLQYDQRFIAERTLFLGPDLAAAHFLVHRNAAVKFVDDPTWYKKDKWGNYTLPGTKVSGLHLEAIDASRTELMFEGFDNLSDLRYLRMLRLAGCEYMDDWTMGRIGGLFEDSLEMLDVSGCRRISAKGLVGLRSLKRLKYLRVEGLDDVKELGKAVLLLEDSIPELRVLGVNFEDAVEQLRRDGGILRDERVFIDGKGNAHAQDDRGRMFYVCGTLNERPAVDDEDRPLVTSTIRREVPAMSEAEFERLDLLSGGKLRHLLVGSPSGYEWNQLVETILTSDTKHMQRKGIPVPEALLPKAKRGGTTTKLPESELEKAIEDEKRKAIASS